MKKIFLLGLAYLLLVLGFVSFFSPIPGALIFLAGGLTLLICFSPSAQYCLKWIRTRVNWFNKFIYWIENKVGAKIQIMGDALKLTRPNEDRSDETLSHSEYVKKNMKSEEE